MTQILQNKPVVPTQHDLVIQMVMSNISALVSGNDYSAQDLIGKDAWSSFSKGSRIALGTLISELVQNNHLPIKFAGKTKSNKCLYQLE
ncbi:MAG: DUF1413 domain-containing protein [Pseudomonadota bacterium]